jgi:beta-xylosidase
VPVVWKDGWPVLGDNGKLSETVNLPISKGLIPNIVASDEFKAKKGNNALKLVWQWNHNPDNSLWSLTDRKGYLRLKIGRTDTEFTNARNTLTQRTIGPKSSAITSIDVSHMKEGDFGGLALLQKRFGLVGVKYENGQKFIVVENAESGKAIEQERVSTLQNKIYLKAECDFTDCKDVANFFYSLNGKTWKPIGKQLKMTYTLPHFIGYRFGLFNYGKQNTGGYIDFDFYHIKNQ